MNTQLKKWLIKNAGVEKTASDDEFNKAAAEALVSGTLSREKYLELTEDEEDDEADMFAKRFDRLADGIEAIVKSMGQKEPEGEKKDEPKEPEGEKKDEPKGTKGEPSRLAKMLSGMFSSEYSAEGVDVRVKEAAEGYSTTKSTMLYPATNKANHPHPLAGEPVIEFGRKLDSASVLDKALAGTWAKYQLLAVTPKLAGNARLAFDRLSDHEKSLLCHLTENEMWDDSVDEKCRSRKGYPGGIKALIDDATSGGLEAAPIVFDDQIISAPLLYGELYPLVNTIAIDRGRRIEGVSTGQVTGSWGGVDDTAVALFNTASYVSAFDTTIYRWEGSVRIGLDFLSDTPIDFGAHITAQYGEALLEDLDDVIAVGNGTSQPEGIINKTGTTSIAFGAAMSIGNLESLRFGVHKREHRPGVKASAVFCGTETSYARIKALNVSAADARRLFAGGSTNTGSYDDYAIMDRPFKINESLSNAQLFYAILARYRMFRRKGLAIRTSTEGDTLIRRNELLIVAMARYGGQLERGACATITTTAPA
jgi:HK97 family phage major capsid protein